MEKFPKILRDLSPDQLKKIVELVLSQYVAFLENANLDDPNYAEGYLACETLQELGNADRETVLSKIDSALDQVHLFIRKIVNRRFFILDGMHGGILYKNIFSNLSDPTRVWAGFAGFPVGFEELDWPEFAIEKVENALYLAERTGLPITLQVGMSTYEALMEYYPDFIERVKQAAKSGICEIVDGTYAQPFEITQGAETNIRDFQIGRKTCENLFKFKPRIHVRQEFGWHPQIPQILNLCGYEAVSVRTRCSGWIRSLPLAKFLWEGLDGSTIPALPAHEGIHSGDYGGGQMYQHIGENLARFANSSYSYVAYSNLEDLTDPMPGRFPMYLASAVVPVFGIHRTYSQFFNETPSLTKKDRVAISRDNMGVTWQCGKDGARWKRKDQYLAVKPAEYDLLSLESLISRCLCLGIKISFLEILDDLWKLFLQALNHDAYTVTWHKTGSYFKARRRLLGKYRGPKKGLSVGTKALQFIQAVRDKCSALSQSLYEGLFKKVFHPDEKSEHTRDTILLGAILVFNPLNPRSGNDLKITLDLPTDYIERNLRFPMIVRANDTSNIPVQVIPGRVTSTGRSKFYGSESQFFFHLPEIPPGFSLVELSAAESGASTVTKPIFSFDDSTRVFTGPHARLAFAVDGQITLMEWLDTSGDFHPIPGFSQLGFHHLSLKNPQFELSLDGPHIGELRLSDGSITVFIRLHATHPRIDFETHLSKKSAWIKFQLAEENIEVLVDYPLGKQVTRRENLTALNFVEIRNQSLIGPRALFIHSGMQNVTFLATDIPERELWRTINSTRLLSGPPRILANSLMKKDCYNYSILVIPPPLDGRVDFDAKILNQLDLITRPPRAMLLANLEHRGIGNLGELMVVSNSNLELLMCRPVSTDLIEFRILNPSSKSQESHITVSLPAKQSVPVSILEVDLEGKPLRKYASQPKPELIQFRPYEFKTFQFEF